MGKSKGDKSFMYANIFCIVGIIFGILWFIHGVRTIKETLQTNHVAIQLEDSNTDIVYKKFNRM